MGTWQVNEARDRFSDVLEQAESSGPQIITRHGTSRAVVLSTADYEQLVSRETGLKEYLLSGPGAEPIDLLRNPDRGREIDL